jgi:hypothetical protein
MLFTDFRLYNMGTEKRVKSTRVSCISIGRIFWWLCHSYGKQSLYIADHSGPAI